jgi:GT2 family glycosyltransferase
MADSIAQPSLPELSVILVSYNTRELTLEALRSLMRETDPDLYELIVLDNASSDGSAEAISTEFPEVDLRALDVNLGFASANNFGAIEAQGQYLLLLNPDTVVLNNAVGRLHQFAKRHPEAKLWGGRTLFPDNTLNPSSCWNRMTMWSIFCQMTGLKALFPDSVLTNSEALGRWRRDTIREVDVVSGCFLMIENALWKKLDGFNVEYFMYGEDADLCLRAQRAGARPTICPEAEIIHYGGASESAKADKMKRLLTAKTTLMRHHWSKVPQFFGYFIFWAFPLPRIVGYQITSWSRGRESDYDNVETWMAVWRSRADWLAGYPSAECQDQ